MPRGVPKNGFRKTKKRMAKIAEFKMPVRKPQTVAQIEAKLQDRFEALEVMADATGRGVNRALIVSGPAGLGKSFTVEQKMALLEKAGKSVTYIKGYVRPMALYRLLYNARHANSIIVFDDADSIFSDDVSMNLLKGACDSTERRKLYWLSSSLEKLLDEEGESVPESFVFDGSVIFITNYDFDTMIASGSKMSPHFEALVSRSHYLDLEMKTKMDYIVRIRQVVKGGMLTSRGFSSSDQTLILEFIENNMEQMRELSLRMVIKVATLFKMSRSGWQKLAKQTCLRAA